jgi:hypothetical protein
VERKQKTMVVLTNASQAEKRLANNEVFQKMDKVVGSPTILS